MSCPVIHINTNKNPTMDNMINIKILFFASAREAADGLTSLDLPVQDDCDTRQLRKILADKFPRLAASVLDEDALTLALNEEYVLTGQVITLKAGDTVALIPPISGG